MKSAANQFEVPDIKIKSIAPTFVFDTDSAMLVDPGTDAKVLRVRFTSVRCLGLNKQARAYLSPKDQWDPAKGRLLALKKLVLMVALNRNQRRKLWEAYWAFEKAKAKPKTHKVSGLLSPQSFSFTINNAVIKPERRSTR